MWPSGYAPGCAPSWVYPGTIAYAVDPFATNLSGRGMSGGVYGGSSYAYIAGCPRSTVSAPTINMNRIPSVFYLDAGVK